MRFWRPVAASIAVVLVLVAHAQARASEERTTVAASRVLQVIERIRSKLRETQYQARTVVREREGKYAWDCSGMATWILERSAPRARRAIQRERPVARDFVSIIARAPAQRPRSGWRRIERVSDARPGDVFAWRRPRDWPRRNTGHVGFLVESPRPVPGMSNAYAVTIVDSTSVPHENDTRTWPGTGGFGTGTLLFLTDDDGRPIAYGWHGTMSFRVVPTEIVFGRVY